MDFRATGSRESICICNSDVSTQNSFPTSKTLQKRSPGPLQNRSQIVQKSLLPGLPLQPTPFAPMTGNLLQTYQKHIPKRVSKNRPFLLKTVFQPPKPSENEGPDPPKINQKSPLILEGPKLKNKQTLPHFSLFLDFENIRKSFENESENGLKLYLVTYPLPKSLFFLFLENSDRKCFQKSSKIGPKIDQKSSKNLQMFGFSY